MTRDISPDIRRVRLFLTEPHSCSYLSERQATTAFVDPDVELTPALYSHLSRMGFRRSGKYLYTPRCQHCNACVPVRIHSGGLKLNRSQRRCFRLNADLTVALKQSTHFDEHYPLYERYISGRHQDGDMYPPSPSQYNDFIGSLMPESRIIEFRLNDTLLGASVVDILDDGLSAIYTYFDPDASHRGLGTYGIIATAEIASQMQRPYVYLGYWIKESKKMAYKSAFRPLEVFTGDRWVMMS
ncbi:MAG: arginyltransferase [bacterium]